MRSTDFEGAAPRSLSTDDPESWESLLEAVRPALDRIARGARLSKSDTEDCVQETILRLLRKWPEVRRRDAWVTYVFRNEVYRLLAHRRSANEVPLVETEVEIPELSNWRTGSLSQCDFRLLLRRVPRHQRRILWLRFAVGLSWKELAILLRVQPSSAKKAITRSLATLRNAVTESPRKPGGA